MFLGGILMSLGGIEVEHCLKVGYGFLTVRSIKYLPEKNRRVNVTSELRYTRFQ